MARFNYDDMLSLANGGTPPTPIAAPKKAGTFDYDEMLSIANTAPVVPKATPIETAVAQTYPEARPEPQAPESFFSKYQKWSIDTGKKIADTYLEFRKSEEERIKANPSSIKMPNGTYVLADPFGSIRRAQEQVIAKGLNTEAAKAVTQEIYNKTSKIGLKGYARIASIGSQTYDEAYAAAQQRAVDPTNNQLERLMYGVADSGLQSVVIAGISLAAGALSRSPATGKAVAAGLFGSVATEAERMDKGSITPTGVRNIAIDTYGDMVISNWAEKALAGFGAKTAAKFLTKEGLKTFSQSFVKAFGIEGSTEVIQSFAKYGNEYASANTPQERATIVEKFKQYVVSGAMMDEFLIGGVSGGIISGGVELAGRAGLGKADPTQQMGMQPKPKFSSTEKDDDEITKTAQESGLSDDIRNALETNSREEVISELQTQLSVSSAAATELVQQATTPEPPSEEDIARELQATRDSVERSISIQKQSTDEIISRTEDLITQASESTAAEIADIEDELKAIRAELAKRKEPEAKLAEEAITLIPAPKGAKVLPQPEKIQMGDTVKIKTNATGVAREAEVVEVREDGVVAKVKGDTNFPDLPMLYKTKQFTAIPHVPKEGAPTYAEWKAREAEKRRANALGYRTKAEEAKGRPVIAETFTKKADELEGKKAKKVTKEDADHLFDKEGVKERKKLAKKSQKDQVADSVRNEAKSIKEIAEETGIIEPNVRRILGVGAKDGEFERVAKGVYKITAKNGDELAYIIPGDAIEVMPKLVAEGFKSDMIFLDIPYDTPAVKGGNRGVNYNLISVEQFSIVLDNVKEMARDIHTPVIHMFSQATSGLKAMMKYNDLFAAKGFIPVGRGGLTKLQQDGITEVRNMRGDVMKPEGIIVFTQSGVLKKNLENLDFRLIRPKGYQTEKPAEMISKMIAMTTEEGDVVFDPFAGSGVVPAEAVKAGRKAVAIEKNVEQAGKIAERVADASTMIVDSSIESLLKTHDATIEKLHDGTITPKELQDSYAIMVAREADIRAWLNKMTIAELNKKFPSYYGRAGEKKSEVVDRAFSRILAQYNPSETTTWHGMSETYAQAVARYVNAATPEQIADHAKRVAERRAAEKDRQAQWKQALDNPQTLVEFQTFIKFRGADKLTAEQRIRYDALIADKVNADTEAKTQQKALVKGVNAGVGFEMHQTKHTKTGADLFVITMGARVEKEVYTQLNSAAKRLGGYYSSFRGAGAIPGFQFKSAEDAQTFMQAGQGENVDAGAKMEERAEEQKAKTTSKLASLADVLEERATEKLNADRKTNTAKRAREASGAEGDARKDIQLARTMRNLAGAIESGRAKYLGGISAKTHIEELELLVHRAKRAELMKQYPDYGEREKHTGEPITDETIMHITAGDFLPSFRVENFRSDVLDVLSKKKGWKLITNRFYKKMYDGTGGSLDYWTPSSVKEADEVREMIRESRVGSHNIMLMNTEHYARLRAMGVENLPQLRAMVREFVTFRGDAMEADKAKELERALIGAKVGFDFFPTPKAVADQMVQEAGVREGMKVLEPSAGNGNIAGAIRDAGATPDVIELSSQLRDVLEAKGYNVVGQDFLEHTDGGYDAIVMNPPFSNNADIEHVRHAYTLLAPGGKLVSIVGEGAFFRSGKTEMAFRDWLDTMGASVEQLPAGTFQDTSLMATTGANGRMVVIEKPQAAFARKHEGDEQLRDAVVSGLQEVSSQDVMTRGKGIDTALMREIELLQEGFEQGRDTTEDVNRAAEILASMGKLKEFMQPDFARQLTLKTLEKLKDRTGRVSAQFISDLTNAPDLKQPERDLIRQALTDELDATVIENIRMKTVDVQRFIGRVESMLLPLTYVSSIEGDPRYENVVLPTELRGPVYTYEERVYSSPIQTSAGDVHFSGEGNEGYFAHTRIEDISTHFGEDGEPAFESGTTIRRVIEIQSDLFQKGRLEGSVLNGVDNTGKSGAMVTDEATASISKLEPYRNTWHERIIREEVAQAARDGKTKLRFPTGATAMKIEGLGENADNWLLTDTNRRMRVDDLKVGERVARVGEQDHWIITDVLGDGKFKAIERKRITAGGMDALNNGASQFELSSTDSLNISNYAETFDISGKMDKENPIYKFYEKEVGRYLKNKYNLKRLTDEQGVEWYEIAITPDMAGPVLAFRTSGELHDAEVGPMADPTFVRQQVASFADRLKLDINLHFTDKIYTGEKSRAVFAMSGKKADVEAWAATLGKDIVFVKGVPSYTPAHEVLHFVVNNLDQMEADFGMSRMELLTAQNSGKMPISRMQEQKLGEDLAHGFESAWEASQRGEGHSFKGVVGRFYDRVIAFVKKMLAIPRSNEEMIRQFYDKALYMRRRGARVTDRSHNLERFETEPGVLNFGVQGDFARKEITPEEFDGLSEEEQRELIAQEAMEDIRGGIELSAMDQMAEDLLNGTTKVNIRETDIRKDLRETLGFPLYARMFRNDPNLQSWDELTQQVRDQTNDQNITANDLMDAVIEQHKARQAALAEQKAMRQAARAERAQQIAEAKTEADKVKVMKAIERDLTKRLLMKKATLKDLGQKQGVSRFQFRTAERFGQMGNEKLPYQKVTKAGEQAKAEAYYDKDKQRTINMALGTEAMPEDVTQNMISIAVIQKAQAQGDAATVAQALPRLSLRSTRFGQEISMLRDIFNDRDPVAYMAKLLSFRKLLIEKKYKPLFSSTKEAKGLEQIVEEKVKQARAKAPRLSDMLEVKGKEIDDFLNNLAC